MWGWWLDNWDTWILRLRSVLDRSCRGSWNTVFIFNIFFFFSWKSYHLWEMWKKVHNILLCFHCNSGYANMSQCYVIHTLPKASQSFSWTGAIHSHSRAELANLWHMWPKWHIERFPSCVAFTAVSIFLFLLLDQYLLYCEEYVYMYTYLIAHTGSFKKIWTI